MTTPLPDQPTPDATDAQRLLAARLEECLPNCPALRAGKCGERLECGEPVTISHDFECPMRDEIQARLEAAWK